MSKNLFVGGLALLLIPFALPAQIITTFAGGGPPDGVSAMSVAVGAADALTVDAGGNVFFPIPGTNSVFRMVPGGAVTRVAGNMTSGYSGDGGPASAAQLNMPSGLAVDTTGNLYIADSANQRIRMVAVGTGTISTVAGNGFQNAAGNGILATTSALNDPRAVAVDAAGNVYISDYGNYHVRKVTAATGIITSVGGNGNWPTSGDGGPATAAAFSPDSIAADAAGNIFIGDAANFRVRRIDATTGIISTVAGTGVTGYLGDGGPALAARIRGMVAISVNATGTLYFVQRDNHVVRKVDGANGLISTVVGTGTLGFSGDGGQAVLAQIRFPTALALDANGNLLIGTNDRIRKATSASGLIETIAGNGSASWSGDGGSATRAQLSQPEGLAVDAAGNVYFADVASFRVRRVAAGTGIVSTVAGNGVSGYSGDGGTATAAQIKSTGGIKLDIGGNLYIVDSGNHRIRRVDSTTGVITTVAGTGVAGFSGDGGLAEQARLTQPMGIVIAPGGDVYISDGTHRVRKVTVSTGIISTVAGTGSSVGPSGDGGPAHLAVLSTPTGLALDGAGNLLIAEYGVGRVRKITAATNIITTVAGTAFWGFSGDGGLATAAQLTGPQGLALDGSGNLFIADQINQRIRRVDAASGIISTIAGISGLYGLLGDGGLASAARLDQPIGLGFDSTGNLLIAESAGRRVRKISFGVPLTLATNPAGLQLSADSGVFTAPQTFQWDAGSLHTLGAPSPQGNASTRHLFASWSNAGAQTQSYSVPSAPSGLLTATFTTQHKVTLSTNGPGTVSYLPNNADLFFDANSQPVFTATPSNGCSVFNGWSGAAVGTGVATLTMSGPLSLTGTFSSGSAPDLTGQFTIARSAFAFNRALNRLVQTVTITNNGAATAGGRFVLDGLSANVTLANSAGMTSCAAPVAPTFATGAVGAGQTVSLNLQFAQTTSGAVTYTPRVLGMGNY